MAARAWLVVALLACNGDPVTPRALARSVLDQAIAHDLSARVGQPVTAHCATFAGIPLACRAHLPDGSELKIRISPGRDGWRWRVEDRIETAPIQAYVQGVLGDLGIAQTAHCPALPRERRIACSLSGGGIAFVEIAATGQLSLELELDPAAAVARSVPPADRELARMSLALHRLGDEEDREGDEPPSDGGVAQP